MGRNEIREYLATELHLELSEEDEDHPRKRRL